MPNQLRSWPTGKTVPLAILCLFGACHILAGDRVSLRFNPERGFYDAPFSLQFGAEGEGTLIRFTLDGSAPSETAGQLYLDPIVIERSTVVRAIAYRPGANPSLVQTHTYVFAEKTIAQPDNPPGFPAFWASIPADYAMDPRITKGPDGRRLDASLRSLPALFISTSVSNLFDPATGIYSNPEYSGAAWERPASIEFVRTNRQTELQVDCGLRIQGGYFRGRNITRKHSFRVLFKNRYGPGKLRHPLFSEPGAAQEFDTLVLRAGANDGYSWADARDTEQFVRDEFGRFIHRQMGHPSPHGRFVHLYLNGLYWGLYNLCERPNEDFSSAYFGGPPEEWDAVNAGEIKKGDLEAWNQFIALASHAPSLANYQQLQGNYPDGTRNPSFPVYFDKVNYIDYMIANIWGGNWDWPNKNFWFGRRRVPESSGFKFYVWDCENTMGNNRARSPLDMGAPRPSVAASWVGQPHWMLKEFSEYRLDFADRVQRHFFEGGVLSPETLVEQYRSLSAGIELAVIAESARWGDDHLNPPQDVADWQRERDWILTNYLSHRSAIVLQQFREAGLFPDLEAPTFNRKGGAVPKNFAVVLSAPKGAVYYTVNGEDPRQATVEEQMDGGSRIVAAVSASARPFRGGIAITSATTIKTRAFDGAEWSASNEARFVMVDATLQFTAASISSGILEFEFTSQPGRDYALQAADALRSSEWRHLQVITADPDKPRTRFQISIPAETPHRFFRLVPDSPL